MLTPLTELAQPVTDTVHLPEISVKAYFFNRPVLRLASSVAVIDSAALNALAGGSIVSAANTAAGVRMEERSPGSYRFSIRGSLLRSPFGVRNVKVYLDDLPLTDAGGNTYLNLLDPALIGRMEIIKGPDGSLFGANSGGVLRLDLDEGSSDSLPMRAGLRGGSYGLFHQFARARFGKKNSFSIGEGYQRSDGYRLNSALSRKYVDLRGRWQYHRRARLEALGFLSDLAYRTPGGLTRAEFERDPRMARPRTAALPGAEEQQAGVHNFTIYGGLVHRLELAPGVKIIKMLFGARTDFENPFITNYERRGEQSAGARAWIEVRRGNEDALKWIWTIGGEGQRTDSKVDNFRNSFGTATDRLASSNLKASNAFGFTRLDLDFRNRLHLESSLSYNYHSYSYHDILVNSPAERVGYARQWMPRVAGSFLLTPGLAWRASASRGYSPPTLAEVLSSGSILNRDLGPEYGVNYETGLRFKTKKGLFWLDLSTFSYRLNKAIVRRVDDAGNEYFTNSGGTRQPGLELQTVLECMKKKTNGFLRQIVISGAYTYHDFIFSDYQVKDIDHSGNSLTGVPRHVAVGGLHFSFAGQTDLHLRYNYTSQIPLNDANSEYALEYHLLQARIAWQYPMRKKWMEFYLGADNLLNQSYSLGNDLNAAGGRYYNAAAPRNYYAGITFLFG